MFKKKTYEIFFPLMSFFVVQKWCDVLVACTANITHISVGIFHVLSHMNHHLKSFETFVPANITFMLSQFHFNLSVTHFVFDKRFFAGTARSADEAHERKLM